MIPEAANLRKTRATSSIDPLPKDLIAILTATCKACPAMYVVLDGLDECQYLTKFGPHLSTLRQSDIKIIITSRDLPDLRKLLQEYTEIEVRLDREDIICYVDWRLCEEGEVEYDLLDGNLKEAIASRLFEHVDGS
jgi:hypothetical protein